LAEGKRGKEVRKKIKHPIGVRSSLKEMKRRPDGYFLKIPRWETDLERD